MSNEGLATQDNGLPVLADDTLIHIAEQAEKRIDAVIKIKQIALKVTNKDDWVDQEGKPYLMASGSEKVANLFNISWRIDEPVMEQEEDGAVTYNYKGEFSLAGRTIEVEGSRSSRDTFFKKYIWENNKKVGEKPLDRRDLKMAALTNLLGNGITRILGIRNLTYDDLEKFAGIKQAEVKGVKYKKAGEDKPTMKAPGEKKAQGNDAPESVMTSSIIVAEVLETSGTNKKTGKEWTKYTIKDDAGTEYGTFSQTFATFANDSIGSGIPVQITYKQTKFGNDLENIALPEGEGVQG
jgi:hypothetical protein